jgi:TRAP-type C4-dicarboxylate transport system substrate-binding protein
MLDVYEAISKDLIDGCFIGADGFASWKLGNVVKYTTFPYVGSCDVFVVTMSNKCWNNLTSDLQKVFTDVSARYVDEACTMWTDVNKNSYDLGASQGVEFITLSASEKATWQAALVGVIPAWVDKMVAAGRARSNVEGWIDYIKGRIDYWTEEQIKADIPFLIGYP